MNKKTLCLGLSNDFNQAKKNSGQNYKERQAVRGNHQMQMAPPGSPAMPRHTLEA